MQEKEEKNKGKCKLDNTEEKTTGGVKEVCRWLVVLSSFNFNTGKWKVPFYNDDETTKVKFPDKDVKLIK